MTRSLKALNKLEFIDGTVKKDSDDKLKTLKWERANVTSQKSCQNFHF